MKLIFGTQEWLEFFVDTLVKDQRFKELAKNYDKGPMILTTYKQPDVHELLKDDLRMFFDAHRGDIKEARLLTTEEDPKVWITLEGSYKTWKLISTGKLGLKKAVMMTRQLKVKGPRISALIKYLALAERIIEVLSETKDRYIFPDEAEV